MKISEFAREAQAKGYTAAGICKMVNAAGVRCSVTQFRRAVAEGAQKTPKQETICKEARKILDELPVNPAKRDAFTRRCRERDLTVVSVWEYYNTTRPKKYSLTAFSKAVDMPLLPFEFRILEEAEKCIEEMAAKKRGS